MSESRDRSRLRSDSASEIGYMDEILVNILSKLPVKDVVACKCVAKHWLKLICEPHFPALQLSTSKKKAKYIVCPYPEEEDVLTHLSLLEEDWNISRNISLPYLDNICSPELTCFLNGLICSVNESVDGYDVEVRIINPITSDITILPKGSQSTVTPSVGVTFDPKNYNFKAFRFFTNSSYKNDENFKCEVFTSSSGTWRIIAEEVERPKNNPLNFLTPQYVSIGGTMYWFAWSQPEHGHPVSIISVDINEKFSEIKLPKKLRQWSYLIELEGCLSVVHVDCPDAYEPHQREDPLPRLEVYKLKNRVEWFLRAAGEFGVEDIHSFNSVAARDSEIFFIAKYLDESLSYVAFDLNAGTLKYLELADTFDGYRPVAFPFSESLLKCNGA